MRNQDRWTESKFVRTPQGLRASRDEREVALASRFVVDLHGPYYEGMLERHARGDLLDLGCGKVPLFGAYRSLVTSVTCVDWPGSAHGGEFVDRELDLNEPLQLSDASFDTILLSSVLEHIREPERLWHEMARVLRARGKLLLSTPFLYPLHEAPHDYYRHTAYRLKLDAERAGFKVVELVSSGGLPEVLVSLSARLFEASAILSGIHLTLARWFVRMPPMPGISRHTREQLPLCYFLVVEKPV